MNLSSDKQDFFKETFKLQSINFKKFNYRLSMHSFSQSEKKILLALKAFRLQNRDDLKKYLFKTSFSDLFLEATRLYLWGISQNFFTSYTHALEDLEKSFKLYQEIGEEEFLIYPLTALVVTYANRREKKPLQEFTNLLKEINVKCDYLKMMREHALILSSLVLEKQEVTKYLVEHVFAANNPHLKRFTPNFLMILFEIELENKNYEACFHLLDKYKATPGLTIKVNFKFMKELLNHLVSSSPIYAYKSDFEDYIELYEQIEVIKNLATRNILDAKKYWNNLSLHNSELYQNDFHYNGKVCLFSLCLDKHLHEDKNFESIKKIVNLKSSNIEKLHYIFSIDNTFRKEDLVKLIWNEEINELNSNRLRQLINRYNKSAESRVISKQDTYQKVS